MQYDVRQTPPEPLACTAVDYRENERVRVLMELAAELAAHLDRKHGLPTPTINPGNETDPVSAASFARESLGLAADEPISRLTYCLETNGFVVILLRTALIGSACSGAKDTYSEWYGVDQPRPLIAVHRFHSWERTRFAIARELGHIVMHSDVDQLDDSHEVKATRFAAQLLAPYEEIARKGPFFLSWSGRLQIKREWGISLRDQIEHLRCVGAITERRYAQLEAQLHTKVNLFTGLPWSETEPGWDERTPERPRLLGKWCEVVYGSSDPKVITSFPGITSPRDVIAELLYGQRAPFEVRQAGETGSISRAATEPAQVIDLATRRK